MNSKNKKTTSRISAVRIKKPFSKKIIGTKNLLEIIFETQGIVKEDFLLRETNSTIRIEEIVLLGNASYKSVIQIDDTLELYLQLYSDINDSERQKKLNEVGFEGFTLYDLIKKEFENTFLQQYNIFRRRMLEEKGSLGLLQLEKVLLYIDSIPFEEWNSKREEPYKKFLTIYKPNYI